MRRSNAEKNNFVSDDIDGPWSPTTSTASDPPRRHQGPFTVMADYIRLRLQDDPPELASWTAALISNPGPRQLPACRQEDAEAREISA